jgi:dextranase
MMNTTSFSDLRAAYVVGEPVVVADLPPGAIAAHVLTARGTSITAVMDNGAATWTGLSAGTHALIAEAADGEILAEEFFGVRSFVGEDPILGFATSFDDASRSGVLAWLRALRCTVVQVYDWMDSYSAPLPASEDYDDPLGRHLRRSSLRRLNEGITHFGAVAQAYAPVCAAGADLADENPSWRLFRNDRSPQSLGDLLEIMDPANPQWRRHWVGEYGRALDEMGFGGLHLDTYGYPRNALDDAGELVNLELAYAGFIAEVRSARPDDVISFNQVNGVPRAMDAVAPPAFRYVEVWPPNDRWRHLEGLLQRSAGSDEVAGAALALYPPVWGEERGRALRTVQISEAVATAIGANIMMWGDVNGVLSHPYYVSHETLAPDELNQALSWHRFALRCRDLFKCGTDTSWFEVSDENASVEVAWDGVVSPEPAGGSVFARVRRSDDLVAVSVMDLTGSVDGSWMVGTGPGHCDEVRVSVLVDEPRRWRAEVAVVGRDHGRFMAISSTEVEVREGRAVACSVPLGEGWAVLRLREMESPRRSVVQTASPGDGVSE